MNSEAMKLCGPGLFGVLLMFQPATPVCAQGGVIEEVVVTARKRTENLQEVPVAVSAVSGEDLELQSATEFTDVGLQIPNLFISETHGKL